MTVSITITGTPEVRKMLQDIGKQAPFALAVGLNGVANDVQKEIQESLASRFTLRRADFMKRTIYRDRATDFATKTNPHAIVRINPARDFLAQHEGGGRKQPSKSKNLTIPLSAVRPNPMQVVPSRLRPRALRGTDQVRKVTTPAGTFLVRNRPGRGRAGLVGWRTEFLYKLKADVPLRPRLGFQQTAQRVIDASWDRHLMSGIERALRSAR